MILLVIIIINTFLGLSNFLALGPDIVISNFYVVHICDAYGLVTKKINLINNISQCFKYIYNFVLEILRKTFMGERHLYKYTKRIMELHKELLGLERWPSSEENWQLLQRTQVQFQEPNIGS